MEVELVSNRHFSADRLSATFALDASPFFGEGFWSSEFNLLVQVLFSLDAASFDNVFTGIVDTISINSTARLVHVTGRDLSARLIEARTQETFSNRTSSEIVTILASRHGLDANVVSTTTPVGRYYQDEHDRITLSQFSRTTTEWDLLVFLALREDFNVFVSGTTLSFVPTINAAPAQYLVTPAQCLELRLDRCLTVSRDIVVVIKSWSSRQKSAFVQTVSSTISSSSTFGSASPPLQYVFVRPNLSADEALKFARGKLAELTMHERVVECVIPGDLSLTPGADLIIGGTGTEFDQLYHIDVVAQRLSITEGFIQRVRARNSSLRTTSINQPNTTSGLAN